MATRGEEWADKPGEQALPAALAADLDAAFEGVVRAYQDRLYRFALRWSGSPRDAEEIAQDAFVRAYRALAGYPPERIQGLALRPWLYQIALNVARNRARGRRPQLVSLDAPSMDPGGDRRAPGAPGLAVDVAAGPEAVVLAAERGDELGALVAALPAHYRAAVLLRHVEGLSYREVAAALDLPVGSAKANVHRGVAALRRALGAERPTTSEMRG